VAGMTATVQASPQSGCARRQSAQPQDRCRSRGIGARGAILFFLPACPPDDNPIDEFFAKLKSVVRRLEPRSADARDDAVREALQRVTLAECANYFANKGYGQAY